MLATFVIIYWARNLSVYHTEFHKDLANLRAEFGSNTPQFTVYECTSDMYGLLCVNITDHEAIRDICEKHAFRVRRDGTVQEIDDALYTANHSPVYYFLSSKYSLTKVTGE